MIARAASSSPVGRSPSASVSSTATIRSCASGSPITPVEAGNTRLAGRSRRSATAALIAATDCAPCLPVKALALPELTMIAAPASLSVPILAWQSSTGAARVAERVNTPATVLPGARWASMTSVRPA